VRCKRSSESVAYDPGNTMFVAINEAIFAVERALYDKPAIRKHDGSEEPR
jgi:hypothetical protein